MLHLWQARMSLCRNDIAMFGVARMNILHRSRLFVRAASDDRVGSGSAAGRPVRRRQPHQFTDRGHRATLSVIPACDINISGGLAEKISAVRAVIVSADLRNKLSIPMFRGPTPYPSVSFGPCPNIEDRYESACLAPPASHHRRSSNRLKTMQTLWCVR